MKHFIQSTDQLVADPESIDNYFSITRTETESYLRRLKKIEKHWSDYPLADNKPIRRKPWRYANSRDRFYKKK
ncbi:MAG: hypothetical protein V2I33_02255 [Kangiellaceae bacterium]|jgi:hypothetical protein|nr:hypothetical protein [Kangiellaceae bacterium]